MPCISIVTFWLPPVPLKRKFAAHEVVAALGKCAHVCVCVWSRLLWFWSRVPSDRFRKMSVWSCYMWWRRNLIQVHQIWTNCANQKKNGIFAKTRFFSKKMCFLFFLGGLDLQFLGSLKLLVVIYRHDMIHTIGIGIYKSRERERERERTMILLCIIMCSNWSKLPSGQTVSTNCLRFLAFTACDQHSMATVTEASHAIRIHCHGIWVAVSGWFQRELRLEVRRHCFFNKAAMGC